MTTTSFPILDAVASNWWSLLIRGLLGVFFGVMTFVNPGLSLTALVLAYGIYALIDGVMAIWVGGQSRTWWLVVLGIVGVLVGIYTFINPGITAVALLYVIAAWAFVRGVAEIVTAIQLRKELTDEWMLILSGVLSILVAVVLFARPSAGALAMVWVIGAYALAAGGMLIVLAFRLRSLPNRAAERLSRA